MSKQTTHRRKYPVREDGSRRKGTYVAGSKKPKQIEERKMEINILDKQTEEYQPSEEEIKEVLSKVDCDRKTAKEKLLDTLGDVDEAVEEIQKELEEDQEDDTEEAED